MLKTENFIILTIVTLACADIFVIQQRPVHEVVSEIRDMPAVFGNPIPMDGIKGHLVIANPLDGCGPMKPRPEFNDYLENWFVIVGRYNCTFEEKARHAQAAYYDGLIVYNVNSSDLETMTAEDMTGLAIPSVFVGDEDGYILRDYARQDVNGTSYYVVITSDIPFNISTHLLVPFAMVVGLCFFIMMLFMLIKCFQDRRRQRRYRLPKSSLNKIPTCKFVKGAPYDTCAICLDDFVEGEKLRVLPCAHAYHCLCIDPWLTKNRRVCPICKRKVFAHDERPEPDSESDSEVDDTMPLLNPSNSATRSGGTFVTQLENPFTRARRAFLERQQSNQTQIPQESFNNYFSSGSSSSSSDASGSSIPVHRTGNLASMIHSLFNKSEQRTPERVVEDDDDTSYATSSEHHSINADFDAIIVQGVVAAVEGNIPEHANC